GDIDVERGRGRGDVPEHAEGLRLGCASLEATGELEAVLRRRAGLVPASGATIGVAPEYYDGRYSTHELDRFARRDALPEERKTLIDATDQGMCVPEPALGQRDLEESTVGLRDRQAALEDRNGALDGPPGHVNLPDHVVRDGQTER